MPISPPIIFIVGPTAIGKSAVALLLAQKIGGEIVSCDSMQVYREVAIASNKPSLDERARVMHHLVDVVSVREAFDVSRFNTAARAVVDDIRGRGKAAVIVGGSGLYMQVLLDGIFEDRTDDPLLRERLRHEVAESGSVLLHQRLAVCDPVAAAKIHPHDARRIIRALEVYDVHKRPISEMQRERTGLWYAHQKNILLFGLTRSRADLYRVIEERVDAMVAAGLEDEMRAVCATPVSYTAEGIIGVREFRGYFNGEHTHAEALALIKQNTRRLAKRQLTWFRREKRIEWLSLDALTIAECVGKIIFVGANPRIRPD